MAGSWRRSVGVFWVSLATLAFEIALTRIFAVAQWYHFAFMSISIALLGFGASGSFLAVLPPRMTKKEAGLANCALLFALTIVGGYILVNYLPFDSYRIAWEPVQFLYLALNYLTLMIPFFLSGLIVGTLLASDPIRAHATYAANLIGSGAGCLAVWAFLPRFGASGTIVAAAICGLLGAMAFAWPRERAATAASVAQRWLTTGRLSAVAWGLIACLVMRPGFLEVRFSPYKALSQTLRVPGAQVTFSKWNTFSRVDAIESTAIRLAPGLSLACPHALPTQVGLTVDGGDLQPITRWSSTEDPRFTSYLPTAAPYSLIPRAKALIIEPRGGLAVLTALHGGAGSVVAVEGNPLVAHVVKDIYGDFAGQLYRDPRVQLVTEGGRAYLHWSRDTFDIIQIALSDTYRPVASGAYSMSESYLYTREAFVEALEHLAPGGILAATRWLQYPPSEGLRLGALALEAIAELGIREGDTHIMAFRGWATTTVLVKRQPFSPIEVERLRSFCATRQFDLIHYPGMMAHEANRYHVFEEPLYYNTFAELLAAPEPGGFYERYEYDVSPPSDNKPFFFHFFKWRQVPDILKLLGKTWQPFGGSGYLLLLLLLTLVVVISALLIILPLRRRDDHQGDQAPIRVLVYFAALGFGYLGVEIYLIQRFVLFLGQPVYAFSGVLVSLLLFSGIGSLLAPHIPRRAGILGLVAMILLTSLLLPLLFDAFLSASLAARLLLTALCLAPLGLLMGLPFAHGLAVMGEIAPHLVPWAWAINGCTSVIASILAMILALSWGYGVVSTAAVGAYMVALVAFWSPPRVRARAV